MSWLKVGRGLGYLALFLLGIQEMSRGLNRYAGNKVQNFLARHAGSTLSSFLLGFIVTVLLQSSSLTSVIVVGLINAGILSLEQGVGIIIGANLGTTITLQILSFQWHHLALPLIALAALMSLIPHRGWKYCSRALFGLGLVFMGLEGIAAGLEPLRESPAVYGLLTAAGRRPLLGVGAGFLLTAMFQSSSAVSGVLLGLAGRGLITLPAALAIMLGADLGTCITALLASLGMKANARLAAWAHFLFNTCTLLLVLPLFRYFVSLAEFSADQLPRQMANAHFLYNLGGALVLLPLVPVFLRIVQAK